MTDVLCQSLSELLLAKTKCGREWGLCTSVQLSFLTIGHNSTARTREWVKEMRFVTLITWTLPVMLNVLWPQVARGVWVYSLHQINQVNCIKNVLMVGFIASRLQRSLTPTCLQIPTTSWGLLKREDVRCKQEMGNVCLQSESHRVSRGKPSPFLVCIAPAAGEHLWTICRVPCKLQATAVTC